MTVSLGHSAANPNRQRRPAAGYTDPGALAIGTARQPNAVQPVQVIATIDLQVGDAQAESVLCQISGDNITYDTIAEIQHNFDVSGVLGVTGTSGMRKPVTFEIPAGWYYKFTSTGAGTSTINRLRERTI